MTTSQQKTANIYRVFGNDAGGNINSITIASVTTTGNVNLGFVDNVHIGGGANGQILQTNGNGDLSWTNPGGGGGGTPGGANTQLQFNNNGVFGGIPNVTYNGTNLALGAVGTLKITGGTGGQFLRTNGSGDLQWANATGGNVIGTGTVTSVNLIAGAGVAVSGGPVTTFGNITVVNTGVTSLVAGNGITLSSSNGAVTVTSTGGGGGGVGTVTSVSGNGSGLGFTLSGTVTANGNITLTTPTDVQLKTTLGINDIGNVANLSLNGNSNQYLRGDGTFANIAVATGNIGNVNLNGNANQFLRGNGTFANIAVPTGNIGNVNLTGSALQVLTGAGTYITPNVGTVTQVTGNGSGLGFSLAGTVTSSGNLNLTVPTAATLRTGMNIGNIANINLNGAASQVLSGAGTFITPNTGTVTSVSATGGTGISVTGGLITTAGTLNIVNTGVTSLTAGGNISLSSANGNVTITSTASNQVFNMSYATENVTLGGVLTGVYNYDLLNNSITFNTNAATGNVTLNFRGNSTTTLNSLLNVGVSITATYIMTTGNTGFIVSGVNIDGTSRTINWVSNIIPLQVSNTKMSFTFTIIKTANNTFTVLGTATRYG